MQDLTLPSFEMDCRDWVVVTPDDADIPDEVAGTPLLAMLSTVVLGADRFTPASGVLTIGLLDEQSPASVPIKVVTSRPSWSTPSRTSSACASCSRRRAAGWPCSPN